MRKAIFHVLFCLFCFLIPGEEKRIPEKTKPTWRAKSASDRYQNSFFVTSKVTSRTSLWKGSFCIHSSVLFRCLRISRNALEIREHTMDNNKRENHRHKKRGEEKDRNKKQRKKEKHKAFREEMSLLVRNLFGFQ